MGSLKDIIDKYVKEDLSFDVVCEMLLEDLGFPFGKISWKERYFELVNKIYDIKIDEETQMFIR